MSSQRSTDSVTWASVGSSAGSSGRYDAERDGLARLQRLGEPGRGRRAESTARSTRQAAGAGAAEQVERRVRRRRSAPTARPRPRRPRRAPTPAPRRASGGSTRAVPAEAGRGRHRPREHGGQRRLVHLDDDPVDAGQPAAYVGRRGRATPSASAWASSRRAPWSESTLSPRGFSTVAASVHGPATWILNAPGEPWACSSRASRSWREQAARPAVVDPGPSVRSAASPAGCRSAPRSVTTAERAAGHRCAPARGPGTSGRCGRSGSSPSTARTRLVVRRAGRRRASTRRRSPASRVATRWVAAIVAEPTTRVPSYTTAAWPGAMPYAGSSSSISTLAVRRRRPRPGARRRARAAGRCPRRRSGTVPHQRGLIPVSRSTASRSRGPDGHRAGHRLDVEHEPRPAVRGGAPEPQSLALADRERVGAFVAAEHLAAGLVDDRRRRGWARGRRASRAASRRCRRRRRSRCRGCPACRRPAARAPPPPRAPSALVEPPSGNSECRELVLVEDAEHVGLVLAVVDGPVHLDQPVGAGAQPRVVAGRDRVEARAPAPGRAPRRT